MPDEEFRRARITTLQPGHDGDERPRALIVDDHAWWIEGLAHVLAELGIDVISKLTLPSAGLAEISELRPHLLVTSIDVGPPEPDMATYLARATELVPTLRIVTVSQHHDRTTVERAFAAGAAAYVTRKATRDDLATAIRHAFHPSVYLALPDDPGGRERNMGRLRAQPLTQRELEVVGLVARGHSNAEVARILWVTEQTVKFHLSNIYRKLNVSNRTEASRWAARHDLIDKHPASIQPGDGYPTDSKDWTASVSHQQ
jgi:DNA-binding NarL/FixJ family response regulator